MGEYQKASLLAQHSVLAAVRGLEAQGQLEDTAVMHVVQQRAQERGARVLLRAWMLGERFALSGLWQRGRRVLLSVVVILALLVAVTHWVGAQAVLGAGHQMNALAAFMALLGMHMVMLLLWVLTMLWPSNQGGWGLGRWAWQLSQRLTSRLSLDQGPQAAALAQGATQVLQNHKLLPWALGMLSHSIWWVGLAVMWLAMWLGFSFRSYTLTWETTILPTQFFVDFVQWTGWLPAKLGFSVPDVASIQTAGIAANTNDQAPWAWWLLGCMAVYGLLPRAVLALVCWLQWRWRLRALKVDFTDPWVRRILSRFDAMQSSQVVDPEHAQPEQAVTALPAPEKLGQPAIVGYELPPEAVWPPAYRHLEGVWQGAIDGGSAQRSAVLQHMVQQRPAKLLVQVWVSHSPDRGTARYLQQLAATAQATAIALVGEQAEATELQQRWQHWLAANRLDWPLHTTTDQAEIWLEKAP